MRTVLGYILTPLYYILMGFFLLFFHPIQWIAYKFFGYRAHKRSVDILNFCLTYSTLSLFNVPKLENQFDIPKDRPIIFVSNHQSLIDIPGLIFFFRKYHVKFISKIELLKARIPSISFNLKYGGGANIDRKNKEQSTQEIIDFAHRMKENNWSAFIFPEGTRTRTGKLNPFKIGGIATIISVIPDVLIVPVCIKGSYQMAGRGKYPLYPFYKISWEVLQPISAKERSADEVIKEAETAIRNSLGE